MKYEEVLSDEVDREVGKFKHNIMIYMLQIMGEKYYQRNVVTERAGQY